MREASNTASKRDEVPGCRVFVWVCSECRHWGKDSVVHDPKCSSRHGVEYVAQIMGKR